MWLLHQASKSYQLQSAATQLIHNKVLPRHHLQMPDLAHMDVSPTYSLIIILLSLHLTCMLHVKQGDLYDDSSRPLL
jgi:hypothetical protein